MFQEVEPFFASTASPRPTPPNFNVAFLFLESRPIPYVFANIEIPDGGGASMKKKFSTLRLGGGLQRSRYYPIVPASALDIEIGGRRADARKRCRSHPLATQIEFILVSSLFILSMVIGQLMVLNQFLILFLC